MSSNTLSASSSNPVCVPSHREYVNRAAMSRGYDPAAHARRNRPARRRPDHRCDGRRGTHCGHARVPRTFLFVDLSGFTNYTAANGDDAAGALLASFRALTA